MLNGTLCATERTMCCVLENNQTEEGVNVPEVLRPFMGGMEFIPYNKAKTAAFFEAKEQERLREEAKAAKKNKNKGGKKAAPKKEEALKAEEKKE